MDFMTNIMGLKIEYSKWEDEKKLPFFISEIYEFNKIKIEECECVMISPKEELPTIPALKKHIRRIQRIIDSYVVVQIDSMSVFRKENMVANRIAFITRTEVYLPFIGTFLHKKESKIVKPVEKYMVSAQVLFLLYIYNEGEKLYLKEATNKLPYSAMTISRAANQLTDSGLFISGKEGVNKYLKGKFEKKMLYEKATPLLSSPVRTSMYTVNHEIIKEGYLSGISALSKMSILNSDLHATYALCKKEVRKRAGMFHKELINPHEQIEIEVWNYDPSLFSRNYLADPISIALSLSGVVDERVEMSVDDMLEKLWEEVN